MLQDTRAVDAIERAVRELQSLDVAKAELDGHPGRFRPGFGRTHQGFTGVDAHGPDARDGFGHLDEELPGARADIKYRAVRSHLQRTDDLPASRAQGRGGG